MLPRKSTRGDYGAPHWDDERSARIGNGGGLASREHRRGHGTLVREAHGRSRAVREAACGAA